MKEKPDAQLLRAYLAGDESAFREIVSRHTDFVYSAALRQVNSQAPAQDIAQSVFVDLVRKSKEISGRMATDASLAGWLYRSTRFAALNLLRDDRRRAEHERQAMAQLITDTSPAAEWERIRPVLDEAMAELSDDDRDALLLRYFKNHDFRTVGKALGLSDDAAQKRVSRAVERLREFFSRRGVAIGASGLAILLSANAVKAAPLALATTISTAAVTAGTSLHASTAITATKAIAMTLLQKTLVATTVTVLVGTSLYESHQVTQLRSEVQALQSQQASVEEQIHEFRSEREKTNRAAATVPDQATKAARTMAANQSSATNSGDSATNTFISPEMLERALAQAHAEPTAGRREIALKKLTDSIASNDIPRAMAILAKSSGMDGAQSPLFAALGAKWGESNPDAATAWANSITDPETKKAAMVGILKGWTDKAPESAATFAAALSPPDLQEAAVMQVINEWSFWHADGAANWVSQFPAGKLKDKAMGPIIFWGSGECPATVIDMLEATGNPDYIREHAENVAIVWLNRDPAAARAWIERSPLSDEAKARLLKQ